MWKRNDNDEAQPTPTAGNSQPPLPKRPPATPSHTPMPSESPSTGSGAGVANIGQSVVVKGELVGSEDLVIDGQVEGTITLRQHLLTIGPGGRITAQVSAKAVVVLGRVEGNITATERIEIREDGAVDGDIASPRVAIAEGAHFRGSIDMQTATGTEAATTSSTPPKRRGSQGEPAKGGGATSGAARVAAPGAAPPLLRK